MAPGVFLFREPFRASFGPARGSILRITLRIGKQKLWTTLPPDSLDDPRCATQACQTQQTCAQQNHRARLRHWRRPAPLRKSRHGSAVCSRSRTEVDRERSKLACGQAGCCESETNHVRTHNPTRLTLDVGVVKGELPKAIDILICSKLGKSAFEHTGFDANGTCVAEREPSGTVKSYVPAVQLDRESGIHANGNRYLIGSGVGYCYGTN